MSLAKTILITGCSSGIGYKTALELKNRGHHVIASARKPEDVRRLTQEGFTPYNWTWLTVKAYNKR